MLVCNYCGTLREENELGYVTEMHGERHKNTVCKCGGQLIPATKCKLCGTWFDNTDLHGVCEGCLSEDETVATAIALGKESTEKVEINGFVAASLSAEKINEILIKWVSENFTDHSKAVVEYLEQDMMVFSEFLEDKYRE